MPLYLDKPPSIFKSTASAVSGRKGKLSLKRRMMCFSLLIDDTSVSLKMLSRFYLADFISSTMNESLVKKTM